MPLQIKDYPLVSVIAISYNHQDFIRENLNSIANQTYPNIELIICDDASTDDSINVIENWRIKNTLDSKFIRNYENQGVCKTLNKAIKVSNGKYLNFIACDDVLMKSKIKLQIEALEKSTDCKISCGNYKKIDFRSNIVGIGFEKNYRPPTDYFTGILNGHMGYSIVIHSPTILIKKDVFQDVGFYDETVIQEDLDMLLKITNKFPNVHYMEDILVKYRVLPKSLSRNKDTLDILMNDRIDTINKHISDPNTRPKYILSLKKKRVSLIETEIYRLLKKGITEKSFYQNFINKFYYHKISDLEINSIENIIVLIYLKNHNNNPSKTLLRENTKSFEFRSSILYWFIKNNIPPIFYKSAIFLKKKFN